jgi:hypothetical protein
VRQLLISVAALAVFMLVLLFAYFQFSGDERLVDELPQGQSDQNDLATDDADSAPEIPTFDVVRVDPDGTAVIAGRGAPNSTVRVLMGGEEIGSAQTDSNGDWVIVVETPLDQGAQELTLLLTKPDGSEFKSEQTVVVAVPAREGEKPLVVLSGPSGASRILQNPRDSDLDQKAVLNSIDYGPNGEIIFSGNADPNSTVRLYVDNELVGETRADASGFWEVTPDIPIEAGVHTARLDQIDQDGLVSARVELPFEREDPTKLANFSGNVIVQPGNSLWRISRRLYGRGVLYTVIYEANKDQIRDPDMIYPGQIFEMPSPPS